MLRYCLTEGEPPPPSIAATLLRIMNGKEESVHFHRCIRPPSPCCRHRRYTPTEPRRREGERGNVEAAGLHPVLPLPPPLPIVKASPENVADLPSLCRLIEEEKQGRHRGVHPPPPLGHVGLAGRTPPLYAVAQHRNHRHCYSTFRTSRGDGEKGSCLAGGPHCLHHSRSCFDGDERQRWNRDRERQGWNENRKGVLVLAFALTLTPSFWIASSSESDFSISNECVDDIYN
nr:hypothetical protein Iba_chr03aCG4630 [Ipomoea batatas]